MPKTQAVAQLHEPLWSVHDLSVYTGVPETTIYRWNYRGDGPPYLRVGKYVRYRREDVDAWLEGRAQHGAGE